LIVYVPWTELEEFQYLSTFGASGQVRKFHIQPSGPTGELPPSVHPCGLKRNFPSHWPFLYLLLSGSDLKGKEFEEGESQELRRKKPWYTEVLALPM
jgi:hypothetical protein